MTIQSEAEAHEIHEKVRAEWLSEARKWLDQQAFHKTFTVDDVRDAVPPPEGIDGRVMGTVFKTGGWKVAGYRKSKRKECHSRPIAIFERTAA